MIQGWPATGVSRTQERHIGDVLPAVMFCKDLLTILEIKPSLLSLWAERSRSPGVGSLEINVQGVYPYTHSAYPLLSKRDRARRKHSTPHKSNILLRGNCIQPFGSVTSIWSTQENHKESDGCHYFLSLHPAWDSVLISGLTDELVNSLNIRKIMRNLLSTVFMEIHPPGGIKAHALYSRTDMSSNTPTPLLRCMTPRGKLLTSYQP